MAVGLSGCPVAADLESDTGRFTALAGSTSTGGSNPSGGAGGTGVGGNGGSGVDNCARPLPDPATFACNWKAALGGPGQPAPTFCAKSGCHTATTQGGGLDLTPNDFLIARLLNRKPVHKITCGAGMPCVTADATCDKCDMCSVAPSEVLLSATTPGTGWVFDKINAFVPGTTTASTNNMHCGEAMPTFNTTGTASYTQAHKDCLILFFTEISKTPGTWPCGDASGGAGGSSGAAGASSAGGGAGGMSTAGAGGI